MSEIGKPIREWQIDEPKPEERVMPKLDPEKLEVFPEAPVPYREHKELEPVKVELNEEDEDFFDEKNLDEDDDEDEDEDELDSWEWEGEDESDEETPVLFI